MDEYDYNIDDVFVSYDELKPGDIFLGTSRRYEWFDEQLITKRSETGGVFYRPLIPDNEGVDYALWNDPGRKYRLKQSIYKYNPDQTGDTEDDI